MYSISCKCRGYAALWYAYIEDPLTTIYYLNIINYPSTAADPLTSPHLFLYLHLAQLEACLSSQCYFDLIFNSICKFEYHFLL